MTLESPHPAVIPPHEVEACASFQSHVPQSPCLALAVAGGLDGLCLRPCLSQQRSPEGTVGLHPPGFCMQEARVVIHLTVTVECSSRCTSPKTLGRDFGFLAELHGVWWERAQPSCGVFVN